MEDKYKGLGPVEKTEGIVEAIYNSSGKREDGSSWDRWAIRLEDGTYYSRFGNEGNRVHNAKVKEGNTVKLKYRVNPKGFNTVTHLEVTDTSVKYDEEPSEAPETKPAPWEGTVNEGLVE